MAVICFNVTEDAFIHVELYLSLRDPQGSRPANLVIVNNTVNNISAS